MKKIGTPAKIIVCIAVFTILIQSIMDLNSTHMTNPLWAPHARFHWSIQYFSSILLNIGSLYLIFGRYEGAGSRLAFVFATLGPLLFWGLFFPALLMPGASAWQDGMTPFFIIPPNVILAGLITPLCFFALVWDRRLRNQAPADSRKGFGCHAQVGCN